MTAELVRPNVSGAHWGGFDLDRLRIAALARAVQTRLPYLHHCISSLEKMAPVIAGPIMIARRSASRQGAFGFFPRPLFISERSAGHLFGPSGTPLYCLKNRASCRFFFPSADGTDVATLGG